MKLTHRIFEIRHTSNFLLFDSKGAIIGELLKTFNLEGFRNAENGIIVKAKDNSINIFVNHDRFGISVQGDFSESDFLKKISTLIEILNNFGIYEEKINVVRIGIRIRQIEHYNNSIEKLREKYNSNYVSIPRELIDDFHMNLIDVGYPLVFEKDGMMLKSTSGPMEKNQIKLFFENYPIKEDSIPDVGIYNDLDCSFSKVSDITLEELWEKTKKGSKLIEEKLNMIDGRIKSAKGKK